MTVFTHALSTNNYGPAAIIVDSNPANGTHTTIQGAINAAAANSTIFIRPGTYTENLTLKAGVNLTAFPGDGSLNGTGKVIISGTCTMTTAGSVTISGIQLQTNSAALLAVTGSAASIVNLIDCYLNCTNNTGITFSSSSASSRVNLSNCFADIGTTGIALFDHSATGGMNIYNFFGSVSGGSTTANTLSGTGNIQAFEYSLNLPITFSSSSGGTFYNAQLLQAGNTTSITTSGTASPNFYNSAFASGSASAISIGAGTQVTMENCQVSSGNTNAITGAGSLVYSVIGFNGTSSVINTTTQTPYYSNLGKYKASGQPMFSAYLGTSATDVTGDGTNYQLGTGALTELYDIGNNFNTNGTFTAPVTGYYDFNYGALAQQAVSTMSGSIFLQVSGTSAMVYTFGNYGTVGTGNWPMSDSRTVFMTAGDTATVTVNFAGGTKTVDIYGAASDPRTFFSGQLIG